MDKRTLERTEKLSTLGFSEYETLHLSVPENSKVDMFLTTDHQQ